MIINALIRNSMTVTSEVIFKSRTNILEVLKGRGFDTSKYEGIPISVIHSLWVSDQLDLLLTKEGNPVKKCYVKYSLSKNLRPANLAPLIEDLFIYDSVISPGDDLIVVVKEKVSDSVKKEIAAVWAQEKILVTVIPIASLQFNILKHDLVPPHRVLSDEEKETLYEKYGLSGNNSLPEISVFDPVAQLHCLRPGQVCEITRPSQTALTTLAYRICQM